MEAIVRINDSYEESFDHYLDADEFYHKITGEFGFPARIIDTRNIAQ